jgi:hypothetical protein
MFFTRLYASARVSVIVKGMEEKERKERFENGGLLFCLVTK